MWVYNNFLDSPLRLFMHIGCRFRRRGHMQVMPFCISGTKCEEEGKATLLNDHVTKFPSSLCPKISAPLEG